VIDPIDAAIAAIQQREADQAMRAEIEAEVAAIAESRRRPRPVLFSIELAETLGLGDRLTQRQANPPVGVALVTEDELLSFGASRVEWGTPDELGRYAPTLYRTTP
jgi:hypothetical protein